MCLTLALVLFLAACSSGGSAGDAAGGAAGSATGGAQAAGSVVKIQSGKFIPDLLQVMKGTTVTWVNGDTVDHQISQQDFESPVLKPGDSWSYTFNTVFTYEYACKLHPGMKGALSVRSVPIKQ